MGHGMYLLIVTIFTAYLHISHGCGLDSVSNWLLPTSVSILDTHRGNIFYSTTDDITGIFSIQHSESLNGGPYISVTLNNNEFELTTNDLYADYEEYETSNAMGVTVTLSCSSGITRTFIFEINVIDTNNNEPQFTPTDEFVFTIAPPVPPGFLVTDCVNIITVRDIDLTTQRIDFEIEGSTDFEITYDAESSTVAKEFKAQLRTTTLIRSIPEPIRLTVKATDVDLTGDPQLSTTARIEIQSSSDFEYPEEPVFSQTFYLAQYTIDHEFIVEESITLQQGYDELVQFSFEGEHYEYFKLIANGNHVSLEVEKQLTAEILRQNQIFLIVRAEREYTSGASSTVIVQLPGDVTLEFEQSHYEGTIEDNLLYLSVMTLTQGYYEGVNVNITGEHATFFSTTVQNNLITLVTTGLDESVIEANNFINLQVIASNERTSAITVVTLEIIKDDNITPVFEKPLYTGTYDSDDGLTLEDIILVQGYDSSVQISLEGEHANYFQLIRNEAITTLTASTLPSSILSEQHLHLSVVANKPRTVGASTIVSITLPADSQTDDAATFEKIFYEGILQDGIVRHESIIISGYEGTSVEILGVYKDLFKGTIENGEVTVQASTSVNLPSDITFVVLELRASDANAVLLIHVIHTDIENPVLPTVTFSSPSYVLSVDIVQTGLIGQVVATADNGETIRYSLLTDNVHLQERLSINNGGEINLSSPLNSGVYSFQIVATTIITQVTATATVHLTVDAVTVCGTDNVVSPLIILDRDEEEPHRNLVVIGTEHEGCWYTLTNRWPINQSWLYVDSVGLHATAIDREDASIAFMAQSQVQVELILHCESDEETTRSKRSINNETRTDWLGPHDYGTKEWILTDNINYNSRRSLVNLIVNDINDNAPIFIGKENEPIVIGYPVQQLESIIQPRALVELEATDADIGENAALVYWSSESVLAVSPSTGLVHVRYPQLCDYVQQEDDVLLTVHATDRRGEGLTGSIDLLVKLLDVNHIVVVTVQNVFLDHEKNILSNLSSALGYDIKALKSVIISQEIEQTETDSRKKRETTSVDGTTMQLYLYGIIENEPVEVEQLTADINENIVAVDLVSTISFEDYLEGREICTIAGQNTGLLAATIVLSILLFMLIVAIAVWFFLKWRKNKNYDHFSDENSLASTSESLSNFPKPNDPTKPRLNIEELKRSERRLQERLDAPIEVSVERNLRNETPVEAIVNISSPDLHSPIIIQSIDRLNDITDESEDDDEFGERKKSRRKSVVTFNENVEKIIHVEDNPDLSGSSEYEVHRL